jgi:subtilisin family serine protease
MEYKLSKRKHKCKLPKFEIKPVLTLQDAKQKSGWNITTFELPDVWEKMGTGEGVTVAVIDSGCDMTHNDLIENLLPGKNFINEKKPPEDDNSHGTHCCGIIAAQNNEIGMVGVAPKAKILPIKALDEDGSGDMETVAKAIRWAADNGADIISMSLGSPTPVQQVRKAIQYAASKGVVTFCAAGNAGNTKEVFYPASYPETIAIGSIDKDFNRSSFSNTGRNLDFMAPGQDIFSTIPICWYGVMSGTSMACPFVAGIAALVLSYKRKNKVDFNLTTAEDYRTIFKKYCTDIPEHVNEKFYEGFGIIDPRKFIKEYKN